MYQVIKHMGLGVVECPTTTEETEFIFYKKEDAEKKADELWKENTTKDERESGWCYINYSVKKIEIK